MASHLATQSAVSDSLPSCIEAKVADTQIVAASRTQPGTDHLVPVHGFLSRPGKRIRACLLQAGFELAGGRGKPPELMLDFVELLHAGSLVIDDIEDDSDSRRGQPTLHRQLGIPIALNAGNWMYFSALEKLTQLKGPAHRSAVHSASDHSDDPALSRGPGDRPVDARRSTDCPGPAGDGAADHQIEDG
jgi:hypothetical protein